MTSEVAPEGRLAFGEARRRLLRDIYERYWTDVCHYVRKTFGTGPPEPEDVAQSVFTKFAALAEPQLIESPRAFLYAAARNLVTDHHRRASTRAAFARDAVASDLREGAYDLDPERVLLCTACVCWRRHCGSCLRCHPGA